MDIGNHLENFPFVVLQTLQKNDELRKVAAQKREEAERQRQEMEEERFRTIQRRSSEFNSPRVQPVIISILKLLYHRENQRYPSKVT